VAWPGSVKWCSLLYRNQGSLFFGPAPLDWSDQVVVITGGRFVIGSCGCPIAKSIWSRFFWYWGTLGKYSCSSQCHRCRTRHQTNRYGKLCVWFDVAHRDNWSNGCTDNITYYECDVSNHEEVDKVAKKVIDEVRKSYQSSPAVRSW